MPPPLRALALSLLVLGACDRDRDADGFPESLDCDDQLATVNPDAVEVCDGVDDDCDGAVDEGTLLAAWPDGDGDGFGDRDAEEALCAVPDGYVELGGDCDDADATIHPDAIEVCDGVDNDCDDASDDADANLDTSTAGVWRNDADADGYGDAHNQLLACTQPPGTLVDASDCDDTDPLIFPGAEERCNGLDDDCDGDASDVGLVTYVAPDGTHEDQSARFAAGEGLGMSLDGGELYFCEGTWPLSLQVTGDALVHGIGGPERVTLDAEREGAVIFTTDPVSLDLRGFAAVNGIGWRDGGQRVGGGLACIGEAEITAQDLAIRDSRAVLGGGIYLEGCSLDAERLEVTGNQASSQGGGLWMSGSQASLTRSDLSDNEGGEAGALCLWESDFSADEVDFGESAEDLTWPDILLRDTDFEYMAPEGASFSCDDEACGEGTEHRLGGTEAGNRFNQILKGNIVLAETQATLDRFSIHYSPNSSCVVDFYVVVSEELGEEWTVIWENTDQVFSGNAFHSSGPIGIAVEEGLYYGLVAGGRCSAADDEVYYYFNPEDGMHTLDSGFGTSAGRFDSANDYPQALNGSLTEYPFPDSNTHYDMVISVTRLE
ncbi:MAG: putative metal-binding motif-containing protein [Alphaproteobacteria bacterium]|nr:putative metal-binding motif-containing protein [Alphaproteobacteria bacterium]